MNYNPKPIDTSDIELPKEILDLCEKIAENTHDVWAKGRIEQGWTYGDTRNDEKKQTPCLVPYRELPESEKQYDRNTALETLKLIVRLGYEITEGENDEEDFEIYSDDVNTYAEEPSNENGSDEIFMQNITIENGQTFANSASCAFEDTATEVEENDYYGFIDEEVMSVSDAYHLYYDDDEYFENDGYIETADGNFLEIEKSDDWTKDPQ